MYKAKVIQANNIIKHPNADNLNLLIYNNLQFVIGNNIKVGDVVVLFPGDGQLSHEFCNENNLYRDATKNKDTSKSGFFDDNRKVKTQGFRGQKSYGFVTSLENFSYINNFNVNIGDEIDKYENHEICQKYYTPATIRAMSRNKAKQSSVKMVEYSLVEHYDTEKFSYNIPSIDGKTLVIITEKCHGTSARTGYVKTIHRKQNFVQKIFSNVFRKYIGSEVSQYEHVSGTRRTVINNRDDITIPGGTDHYRWQWHQKIAPQLHKGETVYYEIVGWDSCGGTIMNKQDVQLVKKRKEGNSHNWKNMMAYSYGVNEGQNDVFVYRITQANESGDVVELSWSQVCSRSKDLGLKVVPVLKFFVPQNTEELVNAVQSFMTDSSSTIDQSHLMEGVCVRMEGENGIKVLKEKNYLFGVLEGYLKEKDDFVDTEEAN